jgi:hypothetical protein
MAGDSPGGWPPQIVRADLSLIIRGPIRVAVVLGRGKLAKTEDRGRLIELGGYQVKLLGEQLRKDGASRPQHPPCQVGFPPVAGELVLRQ